MAKRGLGMTILSKLGELIPPTVPNHACVSYTVDPRHRGLGNMFKISPIATTLNSSGLILDNARSILRIKHTLELVITILSKRRRKIVQERTCRTITSSSQSSCKETSTSPPTPPPYVPIFNETILEGTKSTPLPPTSVPHSLQDTIQAEHTNVNTHTASLINTRSSGRLLTVGAVAHMLITVSPSAAPTVQGYSTL